MKKAYKILETNIRSQDIIVQPLVNSLHFDSNLKQKTFIGGLASLSIKFYVIYIAIFKGIQMVSRDKPYITSNV